MKTESHQPDTLLIAGPCSAETEQQVLATAKAIQKYFPSAVYRAGIWKPRTRPNAFEGIGEEGLPWLQKVKAETGMLIATEVANAHHVEACLKHGIDILWIGARTTVNPFSVQEIASALKGCDIPVMIKNPVNAELALWLGAIERIELAGIKNIKAIHRGSHSSEKMAFRNDPCWELAIELKMRMPQLPIICDPSHICGSRELIPYIAQRALDLGMDGLMIESHIAPSKAWSDAQQQLVPDELYEVMLNLEVKRVQGKDSVKGLELEKLRIAINKTDGELLQLLFQRMDIAEKIGTYKKRNKMTILQISRWKELLDSRLEIGTAMGLNKPFVKKLYDLIHEESIRKQAEVIHVEEQIV
ncbi:MAG: chorismate mutase [Bacteroidia bacterium]